MAQPNRPAPRTIRIDLPEPYTGFYAIAKADFPARVLTDLQSGDFATAVDAFSRVVIEHNLPAEDGTTAPHLADVDPFDMVRIAMEKWGDELGKLPPR
jgi:hypothetical protein